MSVQPPGGLRSVLGAERLGAYGTGNCQYPAAHGLIGIATAIDRV